MATSRSECCRLTAAFLVLVIAVVARGQSLLVPMHSYLPVPGPLGPIYPVPTAGGRIATGLGDVNSDGYDDYSIMITGSGTSHGLSARSGCTGTPLPYLYGGTSNLPLTSYSERLIRVEDLNGDGYRDFLIAGTIPGTSASSVAVVSGEHLFKGYSGLAPSTPIFLATLSAPAGSSAFGASVPGMLPSVLASIGDIDGDGVADFAISDVAFASSSGRVNIYRGQTFTLMMSLTSPGDILFGIGLSKFRDWNGDGFADFVLGTRGSPIGTYGIGRIDIISGEFVTKTSLGLTPATQRVLSTAFGSDGFGVDVDQAGDVTGDGLDDLIVGSDFVNPTGQNSTFGAGRAQVLSGSNLSVVMTFDGTIAAGNFGITVAGPGDVNGDGIPDILVGSPASSTLPAYVECFSGFNGQSLHRWSDPAIFSKLGSTIAGAGDLNGDGLQDLLMAGTGGSFTIFGSSQTTLPRAYVSAVGGAKMFGTPLAASPLSFQWNLGGSGSSIGNLSLSGASPFAAALLAVSYARATTTVVGMNIFVDLATVPNIVFGIGIDGSGNWTYPVTLLDPALDGFSYFVQGFEVAPLLRESNGLELRFTN